jgi:hypothetical protein
MNAAIAGFPNREIYNNKLRNGKGTDLSLNDKIPGLGVVLRSIIADYGIQNHDMRKSYRQTATDDDVRLHWLEVEGDRVRHPATKSICVKEHVKVFFDLLPRLQAFFRFAELRFDEHIMIICAYSFAASIPSKVHATKMASDVLQLHEYQDRINEMLRKDKSLTIEDMPRVLTVDASQGQESFMVIFDGSCQYGDILGFVDDVGRCNVAITRAQEVFWMIGGSMRLKHGDRPLALITKYKRELEEAKRVHRFM